MKNKKELRDAFISVYKQLNPLTPCFLGFYYGENIICELTSNRYETEFAVTVVRILPGSGTPYGSKEDNTFFSGKGAKEKAIDLINELLHP